MNFCHLFICLFYTKTGKLCSIAHDAAEVGNFGWGRQRIQGLVDGLQRRNRLDQSLNLDSDCVDMQFWVCCYVVAKMTLATVMRSREHRN